MVAPWPERDEEERAARDRRARLSIESGEWETHGVRDALTLAGIVVLLLALYVVLDRAGLLGVMASLFRWGCGSGASC